MKWNVPRSFLARKGALVLLYFPDGVQLSAGCRVRYVTAMLENDGGEDFWRCTVSGDEFSVWEPTAWTEVVPPPVGG